MSTLDGRESFGLICFGGLLGGSLTGEKKYNRIFSKGYETVAINGMRYAVRDCIKNCRIWGLK